MKKRVLSLAIALSMVFGCSSFFEQSFVSDQTQITASAATVPAGLSYVKGAQDDTFRKQPAYVTITGFTGTQTELVIPDYIDGLPVAKINSGAFEDAPALKKLTLPKTLADYNGAFRGCKNLETVVIPEGLCKLDDLAFSDCPKLKNVKLPSTVEYIGHNAFSYCPSLTSINIPSKVKVIRENAFNSSGLKSLTLPSSVKEIASYAFASCTALASVTLSKGLEEIGEGAFYGCSSLKSITIPEGTKSIETRAFDQCTSLTSVSLPSTITRMESCFSDVPWYYEEAAKSREKNSGLVIFGNILYSALSYKGTSLTLPSNIKCISGYAHVNNTVKSLKLNEGLEFIGDHALINSSITSLELPASLSYIVPNAFVPKQTVVTVASGSKYFTVEDYILYNKNKTVLYHCPSGYAPKKALPFGLITIKDSAFSDNTKMISLRIPSSVTTIEPRAFYNCTALKSLIIPKSVTGIGRPYAIGYVKWNSGIEKSSILTCHVFGDSAAKTYCTDIGITCHELVACKHESTATLTISRYRLDGPYLSGERTICKNCGETLKENVTEIEKTIHNLLSSHAFSSASCEKYGYNYRICQNCGETVWVQVKPTGHKFKDDAVTVNMPGLSSGNATRKQSCTVCGEKNETTLTIDRLYGADRYKTSVGISKSLKIAGSVVLAQGTEFADALAGVSFAAGVGAPILLTGKDSISDEVLSEIKRLKASKVYVLGGEGAISQKVVDEVIKLGINKNNIIRLAGETRFGTAAAIAARRSDTPKEIFFVYGFNFADALSASPVAALKKAPVIYLRKDGEIDADTLNYLQSIKGKVQKAYVIGGAGVISDSMLTKAVNAVGLKSAQRIWGANRYETCTAVNTEFKSILSGKALCTATGKSFPDALSGGVFAAYALAPMFLADGTLSDNQKKYLSTIDVKNMYVMGGKGAVPDKLGKEIATNLV